MPTETLYGTEKMQRRWQRGRRYVVRNASESMARHVVFVGRFKVDHEEMLVFRPVKSAAKFRKKS